MADNINLATFQFDTAKLETSLAELQATMFKLRKEQESYTAQSREAQKEINQITKVQAMLIKSGQAQGAAYAENEKRLKELNAVQLTAYKGQQESINQMGRLRSEISQTNNQLKAYMDTEAKQISLVEATNKALTTEVNNINQARANNTELLRVRNQLNPKIAEEAKLISDLNNRLDSNNAFIKANASAYEKQKIGIGDYATGVKEGILQTGLFGGKLQEVTQVFNSFAPVFNTLNQDIKNTLNNMNVFGAAAQESGAKTDGAAAATKQLSIGQKGLAAATNIATGATRIFTLALAATGIGLIIAAVVLLIGYFRTFDPVVDKLEQAFAAVGAAVRVLQQAMVAVFSSFKNFSKFLVDPIGSLKSLGNEMATAAKEAANLKEAQQELADAQRAQSVLNKQQEGEINRLMLQSKDRSKSEQERIDLLNKAEKINQENFKTNQILSQKQTDQAIEAARIAGDLTDKEIANLKRRGTAYAIELLNLGKITEDEVKLIEDAENNKLEIYNRSTQEQEKIINRRNAQIEAQEAAAKKAAEEAKRREQEAIEAAKKKADEAIKAMQTELDFYLESQGDRKKSMAEQLNIDKETMKQALAINKAEFDAKKKTKREFELANLEIQNEFAAKQVEATIANADIEFELFKLHNQRKIDENKFFSEQLYTQELERINRVAEAEAAQQTLAFSQGLINAEEYGLAIAQIDENQRLANEEAEKTRIQAKKDQQAADVAIQDQLNAEKFDYDLGLQMERFNRQYALEKEAAMKAGADMVAFEQAQAKKKKDIEFQVQQNKLNLASQTFGSLSALLGEESQAGKAFAIAQATIDTYSSAVAAYKAMSGITIVGPILGGIAAAAAVSSGLATVKKISSTKEPQKPQKPSYASGAIGIQGPGSGTSDSISARLSAGESVINAASTSMFPNLLAEINKAGGGVGLNGETASGSAFIQNDITAQANNTQMAELIADAVMLGAEKGTAQGSERGLTNLSDNRKVMNDAKF